MHAGIAPSFFFTSSVFPIRPRYTLLTQIVPNNVECYDLLCQLSDGLLQRDLEPVDDVDAVRLRVVDLDGQRFGSDSSWNKCESGAQGDH